MKKATLTRLISLALAAALLCAPAPAARAAGGRAIAGWKFTRLTDLYKQSLFGYAEAGKPLEAVETMSPYGGLKLFEFSYDNHQFVDLRLYELGSNFAIHPDMYNDHNAAAAQYIRVKYDKSYRPERLPGEGDDEYQQRLDDAYLLYQHDLGVAKAAMDAADPRIGATPKGYLNVHHVTQQEWKASPRAPEGWPAPGAKAEDIEALGRNKANPYPGQKTPPSFALDGGRSRAPDPPPETEDDFDINHFTWDGKVWPDSGGPAYDPFANAAPGPRHYLLAAEPLGYWSDGTHSEYADWTSAYCSFIVIRVDVAEPGTHGSVAEGAFEDADLDPVGVVSGAFLWEYTDLRLEGQAPLEFTRYYHSRGGAGPSMGEDWRHGFEYGLGALDYHMALTTPQGYKIWFARRMDGTYEEPKGCDYRLYETMSGGYDLWHLDGTVRHFDGNLRFASISRFGKQLYALGYDGAGRLSQVAGMAGSLGFTYDSAGKLVKVGDSAGREIALAYTSGRLGSATNPDGDDLAYHYGGNGFLESIDDFSGTCYLSNEYNIYGQVTKQVMGSDPQGGENVSHVAYGIKAMKNTFMASGGRKSEYYYNGIGNVTMVKTYLQDPLTGEYALDEVREYTDGRLVSHTDCEGNATLYERNAWGQETRALYPDGSEEAFTYDPDTHLLLRHAMPYQVVEYTYNEYGYVTSETVAELEPAQRGGPRQALVTGYAYDGDMNLTQVDSMGEVTDYEYDSRGLLTKSTTYDGEHGALETARAYDAVGRLVSEESPGGAVTQYAYTDAGKLISVEDALGNVVEYGVDPNGFVEAVTEYIDGLPAASSTAYGEMGQAASQTDALGNTTTYGYDPATGHLASVTDPLGNTTSYTYNELGWMLSETDALGNATTYEYDGNGRTAAATDPLGNRTEYTYDEMGRQAAATIFAGTAREATTTNHYDAAGRLASVEDALGNTTASYTYDYLGNTLTATEHPDPSDSAKDRATVCAYDEKGRLAHATDPEGNTTSYTYDSLGRVAAVTAPDGSVTGSEYDAEGRLSASIDALGRRTAYGYDLLGRQVKVVYPDGSYTENVYDAAGRLAQCIDELGNITAYEYDILGRELSATDPLGNATSYTYDACGRAATVTAPDGTVTSYTYDALGQAVCVAVADPLVPGNVQTTQTAYDALGRAASSTDPNGNVTQYSYGITSGVGGVPGAVSRDKITYPAGGGESWTYYDRLGRDVAKADPAGAVTRTLYNALSEPVQVIDPLGNATYYAYDKLGRVVGTLYPDGSHVSTQYEYDLVNGGAVETATDALGGQAVSRYDAAGQLVKQADALGYFKSFAYDARGRLASETDENGVTRAYAYDLAGNLVTATDGLGHPEAYAYDACGRVASHTDRNGNTTAYAYDAAGRLLQETDPLGHSAHYAYDWLGRLVSQADKNGNATTYGMDPNGNITETADALGNASHFTYDAMDRLIKVSQGLAQQSEMEYTYDCRGLLTSELGPLGTAKSYQYDIAGRLTSATDGDGIATAYAYDSMGRATQTVYSGNGKSVAHSYGYDPAGNLVSFEDPTGAGGPFGAVAPTLISRDPLGRVAGVADPRGNAVSYAWDGAGNRVGVTYPDGTATTYTYDAENRVATASDPAAGLVKLSYDPNGNLTGRLLPNGEATAYAYDALDRVARQAEGMQAGLLPGAFTERYAVAYAYDPNGNRVSESRVVNLGVARPDSDKRPAAGEFAYAYDELNRLVEADDPHFGVTQYGYDALGNLAHESGAFGETLYEYNEANQLLGKTDGRSHAVYEYDGRGNLVFSREWVDGDARDTSYVYDVTNRMVSATDGYRNLETTYAYNAIGRRVGGHLGGNHSETKAYVPDIASALPRDLAVYSSSGTARRDVWAGGPAARVTTTPNASIGGVEPVLYAHSDILGSLAYLTTAAGGGHAAFDYGPWGGLDPSQGIDAYGFAAVASYTGHDYDAVLGAWFAQWRLYDPGARRFASAD
ncbi:MAG: DUF6531 domain-containing protein, partial [Oscillospiraceae bacterium]|nr:DUF6531 domain-containing protein [Oscillospiraceae bacterium]